MADNVSSETVESALRMYMFFKFPILNLLQTAADLLLSADLLLLLHKRHQTTDDGFLRKK